MFWPLVLILLAVAVFTAVVTRHRRPPPRSRIDPDQLTGFLYVGAGALVVLATCVVLLGIRSDRDGRAESVAVLGFGAYGVYLAAAGVITYATARRSPR